MTKEQGTTRMVRPQTGELSKDRDPFSRRETPLYAPALTESEAVSQAQTIKALADPTRLQMLRLFSHYPGEISVSDLVESFPLQRSTIHHHLRLLHRADLLDSQRKGRWAYYSIRHEGLSQAWEIFHALA